jgi:hypothetical protein
MSEKKVVGRKVAIALGIICVILVVALAGVIAYYTRIINDKDTLYNNYVATHSHSNEEYDSLQSQVDSLKAAQLHEVNFNWEWNEPWIGSHYVHVSGAVFNSGIYTARNVRINVWLYDSNHVLIRSYTINLGDISGKTYSNFATDIGYSGHCASYSYEITHD